MGLSSAQCGTGVDAWRGGGESTESRDESVCVQHITNTGMCRMGLPFCNLLLTLGVLLYTHIH